MLHSLHVRLSAPHVATSPLRGVRRGETCDVGEEWPGPHFARHSHSVSVPSSLPVTHLASGSSATRSSPTALMSDRREWMRERRERRTTKGANHRLNGWVTSKLVKVETRPVTVSVSHCQHYPTLVSPLFTSPAPLAHSLVPQSFPAERSWGGTERRAPEAGRREVTPSRGAGDDGDRKEPTKEASVRLGHKTLRTWMKNSSLW